MLKGEIIEPCSDDWSNPIVMNKKLIGKYRFCLNFRKVNNITKKKCISGANNDGNLRYLEISKMYFKIDLHSAHNQISSVIKSQEITVFIVPGKGASLLPDALSRMNETEISVASILASSVQNECEEFVDKANEWYKTF